LHHHSVPDHRYWTEAAEEDIADEMDARPRIDGIETADGRAFRIRYAWKMADDLAVREVPGLRVFVHFEKGGRIRFQDDHAPEPPVDQWRKGQTVEIGPRLVRVPPSVGDETVDVYVGLFDPQNPSSRVRLPGCDGQRRVLAGHLRLEPQIELVSAGDVPPDGRSCFARADRGWTEGLHPTDAFLKTTHEVLGPLHHATAHQRLTRLEILRPGGTVRHATYGSGEDSTTVVVNFGPRDVEVDAQQGGAAVLPPWGFVVESPRSAAFYAKGWGGRNYPEGALFTLEAVEGGRLDEAGRLRVFHGFGDPTITWRGKDYTVPREKIIMPGP
ncbi:MAG: hypothetical protein ACYTG0_46420, partial [Planctomycetota bacterium]